MHLDNSPKVLNSYTPIREDVDKEAPTHDPSHKGYKITKIVGDQVVQTVLLEFLKDDTEADLQNLKFTRNSKFNHFGSKKSNTQGESDIRLQFQQLEDSVKPTNLEKVNCPTQSDNNIRPIRKQSSIRIRSKSDSPLRSISSSQKHGESKNHLFNDK